MDQLLPASRAGLPVGALVAIVLVAAEYLYGRLSGRALYDLRETGATLVIFAGNRLLRGAMAGVMAVPLVWAWQYRLTELPTGNPLTWVALFFLAELAYYWHHRAMHRVRWLWATHAVHHSAAHFNLSAAIRIGWTGQLSGAFVFFLPLAWIGFPPLAIGAMLSAGLLYQFFLHTAFSVRLGPLEWILNTPAHHRVHHACNEACLDKNYGSVLILFDRPFGTFAPAPREEPLRFGLKGREVGLNPFAIAFAEWRALLADVARVRGLRAKLASLFGAP